MATTAHDNSNPTLLDLVRQKNPDGTQAKVVEALRKRCPLLDDMAWQEGNLDTGHQFTSRTALPSIGVRGYNEGVAASKTRGDIVTESCGMIEGRNQIDCEFAAATGDAAGYRASEAMGFVQAFRHELETGMFYHSTKTSPKKWMGLTPRLDSLSGPYAAQIINSSISSSGSDQTSIWLLAWHPETCFGIVPKGQPAGLQHHDMGEQMVEDPDGNRYRAWESVWNWKVGLCVKDARYVVRIANIDTSAIVGTGKLLINDMIDAYHQLEDHETGRLAWYTNRLVGKFLHKQALDSVASSTLSIEKDLVSGKKVTHFMGIPIRETDALLNTEAIVS